MSAKINVIRNFGLNVIFDANFSHTVDFPEFHANLTNLVSNRTTKVRNTSVLRPSSAARRKTRLLTYPIYFHGHPYDNNYTQQQNEILESGELFIAYTSFYMKIPTFLAEYRVSKFVAVSEYKICTRVQTSK